jgi:colicin import membrane protein
MAKRLKVYQTSSGFFDLAVAAPSMKAAAEAWGSRTNVFKQGFAKETRDPAIVAATMAKPGLVLRRPVGSNGPFTEHAELPKDLPVEKVKARPAKPQKKPPARNIDSKAARAAGVAFEKEQKRREIERRKEREIERRKEEATREGQRKRREQAIAKAERALDQAEREHNAKVQKIETERAALETRSQTEKSRWEKQKEKLEAALTRASA